MLQVSVAEFPFVQGLPKTKRSRIAQVWATVRRMQEANVQEGGLLPVAVAAKALNVTRSRVDQLVGDGRLRRFEVDGHVFISGRSVAEFAWNERKIGRPGLGASPLKIGIDIARSVASEKT